MNPSVLTASSAFSIDLCSLERGTAHSTVRVRVRVKVRVRVRIRVGVRVRVMVRVRVKG